MLISRVPSQLASLRGCTLFRSCHDRPGTDSPAVLAPLQLLQKMHSLSA